MKTKEELLEIVDWLNKNYNQESENYNFFIGSTPDVIEYNDHIAISLWACGAIVCVYDLLYFIREDDGFWWLSEEKTENGHYGFETTFSIAWAESFANAMADLKKYVWEHGSPVYFEGIIEKVVCHYQLGGERE
mgnify:CR=1 FL=1